MTARRLSSPLAALALWLGAGLSGPAAAEVCVTDDADREVCLAAPAQRIVALSPGVTELLFAAGAGERVVGAVSFSDHPAAAAELPRVGSYDRIDLEALLALAPDLVVAWAGGNPREQIDRLPGLGVPVFFSDADDFPDIAASLARFGVLAGTPEEAREAAEELRQEVAALRERYADATPVPVFYQVWEQPLMTVNGEHWISEALSLCGGDNLFAEEAPLVPRIGREAVLARDPEVIITGGMGKADSTWLEAWRDFPEMIAVRRDNLFFVDPDLVQRATPRLVEGTRALCAHLETARGRR
ncbi:cobalamin-binding protein [Halomonas beimenensis]|uniref:Vitamin B12 ABC transporter, B12-binding component BtuF n=1 Tax=Halomonas beimenensis TaxID=475662 RepID=A0A291P577_9GAMM|nr:cobalamin-binding protein [Halomonas beimenensis]ATJ82053.1 vitamin B12 ABC transporter, B12-binding component BtuF [Halomonas beimenensis]